MPLLKCCICLTFVSRHIYYHNSGIEFLAGEIGSTAGDLEEVRTALIAYVLGVRCVIYRQISRTFVLYCTVLYCTATVLYCNCTVRYCTVLYCTVLYCTALYCTVLYCAVLHYTILYCIVLYCTILYCTVL